jgi:hypothetical protein
MALSGSSSTLRQDASSLQLYCAFPRYSSSSSSSRSSGGGNSSWIAAFGPSCRTACQRLCLYLSARMMRPWPAPAAAGCYCCCRLLIWVVQTVISCCCCFCGFLLFL